MRVLGALCQERGAEVNVYIFYYFIGFQIHGLHLLLFLALGSDEQESLGYLMDILLGPCTHTSKTKLMVVHPIHIPIFYIPYSGSSFQLLKQENLVICESFCPSPPLLQSISCLGMLILLPLP